MPEAPKPPDSTKTSTKGTWSRVKDYVRYGLTLDRIIARERRKRLRTARQRRAPRD